MSFTIAQSVTLSWLLFLLLEWVSFTPKVLLFNIRGGLVCINFVAPLWLITILFFTNQLARKNFWLIPVLLVVPFALSALLLFPASSGTFKLYINELYLNEQARTYFLTWGPLESLTGIYSFFCVLISFCFLLEYFRKSSFIKPIEKIAALLIFCSPITAHYLGVHFKSPFDFKPLTFSFWGVITVYLSLQRQFFNTIPALVWNIFNVAKESMVVLGANGTVNVNKTFEAVFGSRGNDFQNFADELYPGLSGYIAKKRDITGLEAEKDGVYYEISIKNVSEQRNKAVGQLITINDVSETKQLTLAKERARIAAGLHDNMGNRLIASINNLNLASIMPTLEEARPFLDSAATSSIASLMMLRRIVEGLSPVDFNEARLVPMIESVVNRVSASGVFTNLKVLGELEELPAQLKEFIYNTCQEALTNSVIYGRAENIFLNMEYITDIFRLNIVDDGRGCNNLSENNGLTAMEDRARALGGSIEFLLPSFGGFGIHAEIPVKGGDLT
jgi:signal transduction histidine kinase